MEVEAVNEEQKDSLEQKVEESQGELNHSNDKEEQAQNTEEEQVEISLKEDEDELNKPKRTLSKSKVEFGNGQVVNLGKERGDDVDIYYEVHGQGPKKVLLVMGITPSLLHAPRVN